MTVSIPVRLATLALFFAVGAAGCASGPAPRDHFYRVNVAAPERLSSPALPGIIEVDRLRVEAVHQGRRMLYQDAKLPNAIGRHSYHFWADPPGSMLQDQLVRYLREAGAAESIVRPGIHVDSNYVLKGRLVHLERHTGGGTPRVTVEIEFILLETNGRKSLLNAAYAEERSASADTISASISAYDDAVGAIFARLLAELPQL